MELQCKERVTLLEALRESRAESKNNGVQAGNVSVENSLPRNLSNNSMKDSQGWIGGGSIPAVNYPDIAKPAPPLPQRPVLTKGKSSDTLSRPTSQTPMSLMQPLSPNPPPTLPKTSRTPSPDKRSRMKTTLRPTKDGKRTTTKTKDATKRPPAASKAAGYAWDSISRSSGQSIAQNLHLDSSSTNLVPSSRNSLGDDVDPRRISTESTKIDDLISLPSPSINIGHNPLSYTEPLANLRKEQASEPTKSQFRNSQEASPSVPGGHTAPTLGLSSSPSLTSEGFQKPLSTFLPYRNEYPTPTPVSQASITAAVVRPKAHDSTVSTLPTRQRSPPRRSRQPPPVPMHRRPPANSSSPRADHSGRLSKGPVISSDSADEAPNNRGKGAREPKDAPKHTTRKKQSEPEGTPPSSGRDSPEGSLESKNWEERLAYIKKNLPKGADPHAAKQIFNEIVVKGDEVHWDDVAGLDTAKKALKEAVVYPFLRPDLFMGLREPARGMLLFGPPGTGKTMLARAVATESRSTFFAISASSLTSKWLGDSEKLVRALFALARALAPSIIFVDEIDSLLSSRGGSSEHESTRRIKTEFLIQWSDLQRAAAGKEQSEKEKREGDASRVLVLAATNLPWAIDEAARRRFVRRQYIPLPEAHVRAEQLRTLLSHQKQTLNKKDIQVLVELTDGKFPSTNSQNKVRSIWLILVIVLGYSGSDITALAKDAAMGPLRSLGEALLHMPMDEIRPIQFDDFEASLVNIRPSVSKQGLKEFEDWAREFGAWGG